MSDISIIMPKKVCYIKKQNIIFFNYKHVYKQLHTDYYILYKTPNCQFQRIYPRYPRLCPANSLRTLPPRLSPLQAFE